jgi:hypothetical protein
MWCWNCDTSERRSEIPWCWRRVEKVSCTDRVINEVLRSYNEERKITLTIKRNIFGGLVTSCLGTLLKRIWKYRRRGRTR